MSIFRKSAAAIAGAALALTSVTAMSAVIVTADTTLNNAGWALGSTNMAGYTAAIQDSNNFGAGGIVSTSVTLNQVSAVNATTLAGADIFVSPWWSDAQGGSSATAVSDFFLTGGNLFLMQDDAGHDPIGEMLGISSFNSSQNSHSILAPELNNGAFGAVSSADQHFTQGYLDEAAVLAKGGTVAATDANGLVTIAVWDYGDYAVGAGRMVIMADVDFISTIGGAVYTPGSLSSGALLGLNATEYLLQENSVPEPATTLLLGLGLAGIGFARKKQE